MLKTEIRSENGTLTVAPAGRLDTSTAPQFEKECKAAVENADQLVLDLRDLEYISSAGLRVLLSLQKIMAKKGGMKVIHVSDILMEIFEVTGFSDILDIETD